MIDSFRVVILFYLIHILSKKLFNAHENTGSFYTSGCSYTSNINNLTVQEHGKNYNPPLVAINCTKRNLNEFPAELPINTGRLLLSFNAISRLNAIEMEKIRHVRELFMEGNNMSFIGQRSFLNNKMLQTLNLGANKLTDLTPGIFEGLKNLLNLYLDRNWITQLHNGTFQSLNSLINLDLSANEISVISEGAFSGLKQLIYLDLSRNELGTVLPNHFSKLSSLYTLNLGFNRISSLEEEAFSECTNLKFLSLNHNNFTFVPKETMKPLKALKKLDLSGNLVAFIPLDVFVTLRSLEFLNVSFCKVRVFHGMNLKKIMPQLKLAVNNNPLECTCDMLWMKEWLNDDPTVFYHWPQVKCKFPKRLSGRTLAGLNRSEMNCTCDCCQQSFKCFLGGKTCKCASEWAGPSCLDTCQFHNDSIGMLYEMVCSSSQGKCFCSNMSEVCVENAQLINSNLIWQCACKPGFQGDGFLNCSDIDECAQAHSVCDKSADCINTEGSYRCFCPNGYQGDGIICQSMKHQNKTVSIVTTTFSVLVFVVLIVVLGCCIAPKRIQKIRNAKRSTDRKRKRKQSTRRYVDLYNIHELGFTNIVCTQEECLRDDKWEIPREKLHIFAAIGEGAFGVVMEGSLDTDEGAIKVAVKTLKPGADRYDYKDLMAELSIMKQAGSHPNIVSLLGACSVEGPLYLVMEFVSGGNLLCFLRKSRCQHPHYINITSSLNERELLNIAKDVADGMSHLSNLNIVHRDLAARNILLTENKIAKVTDFGLARDLQSEGVYTKTTAAGRLPVKWMAPESIQFHTYTSKSDVWSFGVLLWEIISIGQCPYPGIPARLLMRKLVIGYRMQKPSQCSDDMYEVMRACWQLDAGARPTFAELAKILHEFLARTGRAYINLEGADSYLEQIPTASFDLRSEFEKDESESNDFTEGSDELERAQIENDVGRHSESSAHAPFQFQTETIHYMITKF